MRLKYIMLFTLIGFSFSSAQVKFSEFLNYVKTLPASKKSAAVDSFITAASAYGIPVIEDSTVYFLYRGNSEFVFVAGEFNEWDGYFTYMFKVPGTDLQYLPWKFPADARTYYMIKEKEGTWQKDKYNPNFVFNGESLYYSVLEMPKYIQPWETEYYEDIPHGKIETFSYSSSILGKNYKTHVYLPPDYQTGGQINYPTVYFQDGLALLQSNAANVFDNLINKNLIKPVIGIFIEPQKRDEEYVGAKRFDYADFITEELVPYIDQNYSTAKDAAQRLSAGVSYGGTSSGYISYYHPDVFADCGLLSAVIYVNKSELYSNLLNDEKKDIRYFAIWGTYEGVLPNYLRNFKKLALDKGYEFNWAEYNEGHNFDFWSAHIDDLLINFFPAESATSISTHSLPDKLMLMQNFPNPFNPATNITFTIPPNNGIQNYITLKIYDSLGRQVSTIVNGIKPAGTYNYEFNGLSLSSGVYFYTLSNGNFSETKKMILMK